VDDETKGFGGALRETTIFSADSQDRTTVGRLATSGRTVFVNDRLLPERQNISRFISQNEQCQFTSPYYLDGEPVAKYCGRIAPWVNSPKVVRQNLTAVAMEIDPKPPDANAVDWGVQRTKKGLPPLKELADEPSN
jgi:hypothetical protein